MSGTKVKEILVDLDEDTIERFEDWVKDNDFKDGLNGFIANNLSAIGY